MELVALYIHDFNGVSDSFISVNSSFNASYNSKHLTVNVGTDRKSYYDGVPSTLLIGQNGSGKTTILTFIEDFYYDNENSGFMVWYTGNEFLIMGKGIVPSQVSSKNKYNLLYVNAQIFDEFSVYSIKSNNTMDFSSYLFGERKATAKKFMDISLNNTKKRISDKKIEVDKILKYIKSKKPLPDTLANRELSILSKVTLSTGEFSKRILSNISFREKYEYELVLFFNTLYKRYKVSRGNFNTGSVYFQFVNHDNLKSYSLFKRENWGLSVFPFIFNQLTIKNKKLSLNDVLLSSILSALLSYVKKVKIQKEHFELLYLKVVLLAYFSSAKELINDVEQLMRASIPYSFDDKDYSNLIRLDRNIQLITDFVNLSYEFCEKINISANTVNFTITSSDHVTKLIEMSNKLPKELDSIFNIEWSGLSSGEISLLHLLSSINAAVEKVNIRESAKSVILLLDEIDLYLHPEWQRTILSNLLNLINSININVKIQIIASSHSPIVASDFLPVDIVTLSRTASRRINSGTLEEVGFGEPIDKTMSQGFFLKSTVGDRVFAVIEYLVKNRGNKKVLQQYAHIISLIKNKMLMHILRGKND